MSALNHLKSVRRTSTILFLNLYLQIQTDLLARFAQQLTPQPGQKKQTFEWAKAFPMAKEFITERQSQGAFKDKLELESQLFELTYTFDSLDLKLDPANSLINAPNQIGPYFAEGYESALMKYAFRPIRENWVCYDGQNLIDTDHFDGNQTYSNLLAMTRATASTPTLQEAADEVKRAWKLLYANRIKRDVVYRVGEVGNLTVVVKSAATFSTYWDLKDLEKIGDNTNNLRGKFELLVDPNPAPGTENSVDFILSEPNSPRPAVYMDLVAPSAIRDLSGGSEMQRLVPIGNDSVMAFNAGFWQSIVRVQ